MNEQFEKYYKNLYGQRWEKLRESLLEERPLYTLSEGLEVPYFMDYASVLAAQSLRLPCQTQKDSVILDACAAPGGKTLVIACALSHEMILLSNELSSDRRRRLSAVLDSCLNNEKRKQVRVCGFDAAKAGSLKSEHNRFSAILLDAPCSSESHVLKDSQALAAWTPARPKFLAQRQWSLLSSVFLMLKEAGSLVYSTCAITKIENDDVVEKLFKKYKDQVIIDPPDFQEGETTKYGKLILPDKDGIGPLYVSRIKKR